MSIKVLVTTGCGNTVMGGADIWTNYFLELVWIKYHLYSQK